MGVRPTALLLTLMLAACGCVAAEEASASPSAAPSAAWASPSATTSPGPSSRPSPSPDLAPENAVAAARRLLEATSASVRLDIRREKRPGDPIEVLLTGDGRVEPALGRGLVRYDLSGLFAVPGASASPASGSLLEAAWTAETLWVLVPNRADLGWQARARTDARLSGGLIGRLPDEVLGLVELVARSAPDDTGPAPAAMLDGRTAQVWVVRVPLEASVAAGVPADLVGVDAFREVYGIDTLEIEVWLLDGELRRLRYALAREKALYGVPDRTTVTYDWLVTPGAEPIELPAVSPSPSPGGSVPPSISP